MTVAAAIFLVTFGLIISEKIHRALAAIVGAITMVTVGHFMGFMQFETVVKSIDWNTLGLLLGMMIIVGILGETGAFEYVAIKTAKLAKGNLWRIMMFFVIVTALVSAFLDNVTTVLLMAPVTISIAKTLNVNPVPFIVTEVLASNIGGTATLIGDPPNILIGSAAGIPFNAFLVYLAPIVVVILVFSLIFFRIYFRRDLGVKPSNIGEVMDMDERQAIKDRPLMVKGMAVFGVVVVLFVLHDLLELPLSLVALAGATAFLVMSYWHPDRAMKHVEWTTLMFFAALFVVVEGLNGAGIITTLGGWFANLSGGNLLTASVIMLWFSGIAATFIGNIPLTIALIPLVKIMVATPGLSVAAGVVNPIWWALSLGACMGGNGFIFSAPANVIVAGISERMGMPISFRKFASVSLPTLFISLAISTGMLYLIDFALT